MNLVGCELSINATKAILFQLDSDLKTAVVVPTLNAGSEFSDCLDAVARQSFKPDFLLIIDSASEDGTPEKAKQAGFDVKHIKRSEFDHGGTRLWAARYLDQADIIVYLTQDAILADDDSLSKLVSGFSDSKVASAYGRQLPADNATALARHHRDFNYGAASYRVNSANVKSMGIRGVFCSNSFAAYRRTALLKNGGFPEHLIMGEDMLAAGALISSGYTHVYCADACVKHSHNFTLRGEFKRFFDTGVFHNTQPSIRALLATTQAEGAGFVRSELRYAWERGGFLCFMSLVRNIIRASGYYIGFLHKYIPLSLNRRLSNCPAYWQAQDR